MIGREQSRDLKDFLQKYEPSGRFTGMVGPEGGFTPEEVSTAQHAGFYTGLHGQPDPEG